VGPALIGQGPDFHTWANPRWLDTMERVASISSSPLLAWWAVASLAIGISGIFLDKLVQLRFMAPQLRVIERSPGWADCINPEYPPKKKTSTIGLLGRRRRR